MNTPTSSHFVAKCSTEQEDYFEVAQTLDGLINQLEGFDCVKYVHEYNVAKGSAKDISELAGRRWLHLLTEKFGKIERSRIPAFIIESCHESTLDDYEQGGGWNFAPTPPAENSIDFKVKREVALDVYARLSSCSQNMLVYYHLNALDEKESGRNFFADALEAIRDTNGIVRRGGFAVEPIGESVIPVKEDSDNDNGSTEQ